MVDRQESSRFGTTQVIAFDGTTGITNAFGTQTRQVRLATDSPCNYKIGDGTQTATTADNFLSATWVEYVTVSPGQKISAVKAATESGITATAGTLWVSEMT